ncbi:TonB-dependent receptor [Hymenobacter sp. PAMC 26628]|nr:TonB-dependent receptor [Hymenobacter sp. PAMC 26628]
MVGLAAGPARAQPGSGPGATLRGTALDATTGEPLIGATVLLLQTAHGATAGLDGSFLLKNVPAGAAVVQCQSVGYAAQQQAVTLVAGQTLGVSFRLKASGQELAEAVVTGQADRESAQSARRSEQKADNVLNIISARTIELSPDVTVGNVVQRASGVSVVRNAGGDGQYAIIRGMDRRYNYTLVNGIKIPSPDPKNRYVPLDIFPAELLERLEVIKALTPNMEGDAIGGALNMVMKSAPDHLVVAATVAGGYSDLFATRPFAGFSTSGLAQQSPGQAHSADYVAKPGDLSNAALNYSSIKVPVNSLFGLTIGNRTRDGKLGLLVAGSLQSTYRGSDRLFYRPLGQPKPEPLPNTFTFDEIQRREYSLLQIRTGLHAKLDYVPNARNRVSLYSLLVRLDDAQHRHITTNDLGTGGDVPISDQSRFQRQQLWSETLQGDHTLLPRLTLNWSAVYGRATFDTPNQTDVTIVRATAANTQQGTFVQSSSHLWQHSFDQDVAGYANLSFAATDKLEFTAGGMVRNKDRTSTYDYYDLDAATTGTGTNNRQPFTSYDQARFVFNLDNGLQKSTDGNNYVANERITAGYAQAKILLADKLQILGGVRLENTNQHYDSQLPATQVGRSGTINYLDVLPSVHFKYLVNERQNLRLSYFKGITRPNLFELVPAINNLNNDYYTEAGNPYLKHTQADNIDLRYEYFGPAASQLLAGVFYKNIQNPIEYGFGARQALGVAPTTYFSQVSNNTFYYTPQNFGNAVNFGAELVFTKYIRNWGLTGNYTYTHSSITTTKRVYYRAADGTLTTAGEGQPTAEYPSAPTQTRPLQGQSDHIANLALLYRSEATGLHAQLAAVYTGRRINLVSPYKDLDQWQRATTQLDFSAEKKLPQHLTVFLKVTNLLNTPTVVEVLQAPTGGLLTAPEQTRADRILVQRDVYNRTYLLGLRYRLN